MRRHLVPSLLALAVVALSGTAALAQPDGNPGPRFYGDRYSYDRSYADDDRHDYRYGNRTYQPYQYQQPYHFDQRAQRYGGGLQILEAWYGRGRRACDAAHSMRRACEGQPGCEAKAGNELCGDPTPGQVKTLYVSYRCRGRVRDITRQEGKYLRLDCD